MDSNFCDFSCDCPNQENKLQDIIDVFECLQITMHEKCDTFPFSSLSDKFEVYSALEPCQISSNCNSVMLEK